MNIRISIQKFLEVLKCQRCLSGGSLRVYESQLHKLANWLFDTHMASDVEHLEVLYARDVARFWTDNEHDLTTAGKKLRRSITSNWIGFLQKHSLLKSKKIGLFCNPKSVTASKQSMKPIEPKADLSIREVCLWELLSAGLRIAEIAEVSAGDFTMDYSRLIVNGKGSKQRIAIFSESSSIKIQAYFSTKTLLCKPFNAASLSSLRNEIKGLSVEGNAPHDFRRNFASDCYKHNVDAQTIQTAMGHSSMATTIAYMSKDAKTERMMKDYKMAHPRA